MTRQKRMATVSLTLDELLARSPWFVRLDEPTQSRVRADVSERAVAAGQALGHHGERQHA